MTGIETAFDDTGGDSPPLVLIHGAYSSRRVFADQVGFFAGSRRVIAPDLRGHGESDKPPGPYSLPELAADVVALCDRLGFTSPADLVGHSIGGAIAVEMAAQRPSLVRSITTLDSPSIIPGWSKQHKSGYAADIASPDFRRVLREYLDVAASPLSNPAIRQEELEEFAAVPDHVLLAIWGITLEWAPERALALVEAPLLYIDHGQPDLDFDALRALCPQLITGQTVGAGHRALREVPEQVNAMISRFLEHAESLAAHATEHGGGFKYRN